MSLKLPSRYENLDVAFRGRLRPNQSLLDLVKRAFASIEISGGIRFLPIYGQSGSGKTSASFELGTHLPELHVEQLPREAIEDTAVLSASLDSITKRSKGRKIVAIIDQYEEVAAQKTAIPSNFVESLSLLDRDRTRSEPIVFIWLTTSKEFQSDLQAATTRNKRILFGADFEINAIEKIDWPGIIEETFQFHNQDKSLSDYEIIDLDLVEASGEAATIGSAIENVGYKLAKYSTTLHDLSSYLIVMLWPVTDGLRISRVQQFTDPRQGYKLDWNSWYRQLNADDQNQLPLREYNRARLYFDVRLVPIAAADLYPLCRDLDNDEFQPGASYLRRFKSTHFFSIISGSWSSQAYAPLRERESKRAEDARAWYSTVTTSPIQIGKRLSKCLNILNLSSDYEKTISSPHGKVKADVFIKRLDISPSNVIVELKSFAPENTMPSTIAASVQTTLKRHAQFGGFLSRQ